MYMSEFTLESLKKARMKAGFTQKEVEQNLRMRNLMVRDYEMGRLKLPVQVAISLSNLYGISLDELLGNEAPTVHPEEGTLEKFKTLFNGNGFGMMFLDPVIRGYLEEHHEELFFNSIFELLTKDCSEKKKKQIVIEIAKFLNSLSGSDGRVSSCERKCVFYILDSFGLENKSKQVSTELFDLYMPTDLPSEFSRVEIKHFVIWILFFFANADGEIKYQEAEYIEMVAEILKMNRSNFISIKNQFIKEQV